MSMSTTSLDDCKVNQLTTGTSLKWYTSRDLDPRGCLADSPVKINLTEKNSDFVVEFCTNVFASVKTMEQRWAKLLRNP